MITFAYLIWFAISLGISTYYKKEYDILGQLLFAIAAWMCFALAIITY